MTKSPMSEDPINGNGEEYDSLTRIRGIGPVTQQLLRESLNIYTFRDLTNLSIDQIESELRADGQTASRSEIEGWIVQAQEIVAAKELSPKTKAEESANLPTQEDESDQQEVPLLDTLDGEGLTPQSAVSGWSSFASFIVEFQHQAIEGQVEEQRIKVCHQETNTATVLPGIKTEELQEWMLNQFSDKMQQVVGVQQMWLEREPEKSSVATPVVVEISQLRLFQPPKTDNSMLIDRTNQLFPGTLNGAEPFVLETVLKFTGLTEEQIVQQPVTYSIQCYVRDRSTGVITHLGDTEPDTLVKGQSSYIAVLPEVSLPQGRYRLQVLATLQGLSATPGFLEVPLLPVI
ncbi:MAG: hypothetical protein WA919_11520 [Coleofasciculaceae cyanobacterium]